MKNRHLSLPREIKKLVYGTAAQDRGLPRLSRVAAEHRFRKALLDALPLSPGLGEIAAWAMGTYRHAVNGKKVGNEKPDRDDRDRVSTNREGYPRLEEDALLSQGYQDQPNDATGRQEGTGT